MRWILLALALVGCGSETQDGLIVSPENYDYGSVAVGESKEATFLVWNPTMAPQDLSMTIAPMGPELLPRLGSCGVTLQGGEACTVVVRLAPQSPGTKRGVVTLGPGAAISLIGSGAIEQPRHAPTR